MMTTLPADEQRHALLAEWTGPNAPQLAALLARGDGPGFDRALLQYMRQRRAPRFFYQPAEVPDRAQALRAHLPDAAARVIAHADGVRAGMFPDDTSGDARYTTPLPQGFSWRHNPTRDPEFVHALNRHRFFIDLAMAYRLTGEPAYLVELTRLLESWIAAHAPLEDWSKWGDDPPRWHLLDAAIRADTWPWTYFLAVDTPEWTPRINTLFLRSLCHHAVFLHQVTPYASGTNWVIMQAQGLMNIALLFPEFRHSASWEAHATVTLTACVQEQFYADGGHFEQSLGYHQGCLRWLSEAFQLARLNGRPWADAPLSRLRTAAEALFQQLNPDGTMPDLSDSQRITNGTLRWMAQLLDEPAWAAFSPPDDRQVWLLGAPALSRTAPEVHRPATYVFPRLGYYLMRTGDAPDARQLTFDCGPKGHWHGHFDLLHFELYGWRKPLICDLGLVIYGNTPERRWAISTPAHNTISVDGQNHAALEGPDHPGFRVTAWETGARHALVSGVHRGYDALDGSPVVARSIWWDHGDLFVIVDWGWAEAPHRYDVSFTVPTTEIHVQGDGCLSTATGTGDVWLQVLPRPGQQVAQESRFWSPRYMRTEPATRVVISQCGRRAIFATLVAPFRDTPPRAHLEWVEAPSDEGHVRLHLQHGDRVQIIELARPRLPEAEH